MTVTKNGICNLVLDYLGIEFDFSQEGVMKLSMMNNIMKIFGDFLATPSLQIGSSWLKEIP